MTDTRIAELLDELTPTYDDRRGDWERVAASARGRRPHRSAPWWVMRLGFAAAAIAVAAALALAWPFHGNQGGLLDRALAAIELPAGVAALAESSRLSGAGVPATFINLADGRRLPAAEVVR